MGTDLADLDVELQFWSLVYSDEQLFQAEFAALVADIEIPPRTGRCRRRASRPASDDLAEIRHRDIRVRRVSRRVHCCGRSPPDCGDFAPRREPREPHDRAWLSRQPTDARRS